MARTARISGDVDTATISEERREARQAATQLGGQVGQIDDSHLIVDEENEQERFFAEIDEAASASLVHVYLIMPDGDEPKVWKGPPDKFNMEAVARNFGSGKYRVVLYAPLESGRLAKRVGKIVSHLLSPDEERDLKRRREGRDDGPIVQPISESRIVELIRAAQPQQNALSQFKEFAEVMRTVMPQPVAAAPVDSFAMMRNVLGLVREMQPEAPLEKGAGIGDVAFRLIEKFGPQIAAAVAQPPNGAPGVTAPQLPAPATTAQQTVSTAVESDEMLKLKFGLSFLCDQAKNGKDASLYADVVLDNVPKESLAQMMGTADFVAFLAQFHPPVAQYRAWFDELKAHVQSSLSESAAP